MTEKRRNAVDKFENRHLFRVAQVEHVPGQSLIGGAAIDALDQIVHETKASRLPSVTVHGERNARQRSADELRHDTAVIDAHARPVGVEDPDDARIETVRAVVRHRHGLGEALCLVVNAPRSDRVDAPPIRFRLRMDLRTAVDLACGREQKTRAVRFCQREHAERAQAIDLERLDRVFQIVAWAGG